MNASPSVQRGMLLLEQNRFSDAETYFREALSTDPTNARIIYLLAACQYSQDQNDAALETSKRALELEPEYAAAFALRAHILADLRRFQEALSSANEALRIDPEMDFAFTARASVYLRQNEWNKAESDARSALELDPNSEVAANQLAQALRMQNRLGESAEQIQYMLSEDPESTINHNSAGWLALQRGQNRQAEEHFLEALRLDASNEAAKEGLKEAFRARSLFYRAYLKYCFFMQRFTQGRQWLLIIGLVVGIQVVEAVLPGPIGQAVIGLYLLFVLWGHVAPSVGNWRLFLDRFARHALSRMEKLDAWFVGFAVIVGLPLFALGAILKNDVCFLLGATLLGAAFPLAYTFKNNSLPGRCVFACAAASIYFLGAVGILIGAPALFTVIPVLIFFLAMGSTWLTLIPHFRY